MKKAELDKSKKSGEQSVSEITKTVAEKLLNEKDSIDKLINNIITVEKQHKHISRGGTDKKEKSIGKLIDVFIDEELENYTE